MSPAEICPACGEPGGALRHPGFDDIKWKWHMECWFDFARWLLEHDDPCLTPEKCAKRFLEYLARKRARP